MRHSRLAVLATAVVFGLAASCPAAEAAPGCGPGTVDGQPAYWTGTTPHRLPLSRDSYTSGAVLAVNHFGLMVGWVQGPDAPLKKSFRYWAGDSHVDFYPRIGLATDLNDAGYAVGYSLECGECGGWAFGPGTTARDLAGSAVLPVVSVTGINNAGQIVGAFGGGGTAVYWSSATAQPMLLNPEGEFLEDVPGWGTFTLTYRATSIDGNTHVIGRKDLRLKDRGVFWSRPGQPAQEVPLTVGGLDPGSRADQDLGVIFAGTSRTSRLVAAEVHTNGTPFSVPGHPYPRQAAYWRYGHEVEALPRLSPGGLSTAFAAHDDGRVGGSAADTDGQHPVIWQTCA